MAKRPGRLGRRASATSCLDTYALANPRTTFLNQSFSDNPTIAVPASGLGAAFGAMLTDHIYVVGSVSDANGSNTSAGFNTFFNEGEFFKHIEVGWVSSFARRNLDNIHVVAWHADQRRNARIPDGWGLTVSATQVIHDQWMPFLRAGYSEGPAPLKGMVSAGFGRYFSHHRDLMGLGTSWGQPRGKRGRDQYTTELFYRMQLAQNFALTPDIQLLFDPAFNPHEDLIAVFGIRGRVTL